MTKQISARELAKMVYRHDGCLNTHDTAGHAVPDVVGALLEPPAVGAHTHARLAFAVLMAAMATVMCEAFGGVVAGWASDDFAEEGAEPADAWLIGIKDDGTLPPDGGVWGQFDLEGEL